MRAPLYWKLKSLEKEKMKNKNIFDIEDLSDLPDALSLNITKKKKSSIRDMVIGLFSGDIQLSIDQIMVGTYRVNKKIISRSSAGGAIQHLIVMEQLKRVSTGVYTLFGNGENK